jgi:hypothetical protein
MAVVTAAQMEQVEADCYHCLTNMLDKAQVGPVLVVQGVRCLAVQGVRNKSVMSRLL